VSFGMGCSAMCVLSVIFFFSFLFLSSRFEIEWLLGLGFGGECFFASLDGGRDGETETASGMGRKLGKGWKGQEQERGFAIPLPLIYPYSSLGLVRDRLRSQMVDPYRSEGSSAPFFVGGHRLRPRASELNGKRDEAMPQQD
jgi:hypothetical protein